RGKDHEPVPAPASADLRPAEKLARVADALRHDRRGDRGLRGDDLYLVGLAADDPRGDAGGHPGDVFAGTAARAVAVQDADFGDGAGLFTPAFPEKPVRVSRPENEDRRPEKGCPEAVGHRAGVSPGGRLISLPLRWPRLGPARCEPGDPPRRARRAG